MTIKSVEIFLQYLLCCYCLVTKLCPTLFSMDYGLPDTSVHGISQARILEWSAMSFSRGSFWPRDWTNIFCIGRQILYHWATREVQYLLSVQFNVCYKDKYFATCKNQLFNVNYILDFSLLEDTIFKHFLENLLYEVDKNT